LGLRVIKVKHEQSALLNRKLHFLLDFCFLLLFEDRGFVDGLLVQLSQVDDLVLVAQREQLGHLHENVVLGELAAGSPDQQGHTALGNTREQTVHEVLGLVNSEQLHLLLLIEFVFADVDISHESFDSLLLLGSVVKGVDKAFADDEEVAAEGASLDTA